MHYVLNHWHEVWRSGAVMSNQTATLLTLAALFVTTAATVKYAFLQRKLIALMEEDLRFRVSPILKYRQVRNVVQHDSSLDVTGRVQNTGNGYAVDLEVKMIRSGSPQTEKLDAVPSILAPRDEVEFSFHLPPKQPNYVIEMRSTDSAELNDYYFKWNDADRLVRRATTTRPRKKQSTH